LNPWTVESEAPTRICVGNLEVKVHARVNVRILELIDASTGSAVELEGNRLPITHSRDLIRFLAGDAAICDADAGPTRPGLGKRRHARVQAPRVLRGVVQ
jgi:hypothetical protein